MLASHERYFRIGGRTLYAFMLPLTEYQGMGSNKSHHTEYILRNSNALCIYLSTCTPIEISCERKVFTDYGETLFRCYHPRHSAVDGGMAHKVDDRPTYSLENSPKPL